MARKPTQGSRERAALRELRAMSRAQIRALQSKIGVDPDGVAGSGTASALVRHRKEQAVKAERAARAAEQKAKREAVIAEQQAKTSAAKAAAEQRKAEAETKRAEAEAQRIAAEAEKTRLTMKAESEKRKEQAAQRKAREATIGGASSLAAAVGGVTIGKKVIAKGLDARFKAAYQANRAQIEALAKESRSAMSAFGKASGAAKAVPAAKLSAIAKTAKMTLPAMRSPLGIGIGVAAGGLGAFSLYRGQTESEFVSRLAFNTSAGAEIGVAVGTIGQQIANRANPTTTIPAKALADIKAGAAVAKSFDPKAEAAKAQKPKATRMTPKQRSLAKAQSLGIKGVDPSMTKKAIDAAIAGKQAPKGLLTLKNAGKAARVLGKGAARAVPIVGVGLAGLAMSSGINQAVAATRRGDAAGAARGGISAVEGALESATGGAYGLYAQAVRWGARQVMNIFDSKEPKVENKASPQRAFRDANAQFVARRRAERTSRLTDKPDGYVEGHTRRSGTKIIKIDTRKMTAKELRK